LRSAKFAKREYKYVLYWCGARRVQKSHPQYLGMKKSVFSIRYNETILKTVE
jgi:hypothetical protein